MDYAAVKAIFFAPPRAGAPVPGPFTGSPSPARRLRDAIEPLACQSIWSPEAEARYRDLGLDDFFAAYVGQRTAPMGAVPATLAVTGLGVFEPGTIAALHGVAAAAVRPAELARARRDGAGETVRRLLGDIDADAARVVTALRRGIEAADRTARPVFSGLVAEPWPDDPLARLVHACVLLREHRGDSHLAVLAVAGIGPVEANVLTGLYCGFDPAGYAATRCWAEADIAAAVQRLRSRGWVDDGGLTADGLRERVAMEERTDGMQRPVVDAIGPDLDVVTKQLDGWSNALVAAGAAPPDPAKRAAG